jgi:hypothetical protein
MPDWLEFTLLTLATYRLWRIIGADTVLGAVRDRVTRRDRYEADPDAYRRRLDEFLHCAWCLGFWVALTVFGAWLLWPAETIWVCVPLAISTAVGLLATNWD